MNDDKIKKAFDSYRAKDYHQWQKDWDYKLHDVMNESIRPKEKVVVRDETFDANGNPVPAVLEDMEVNRITVPLEQEIVNKHTSFTVGREPELLAEPATPEEQAMLTKVQRVQHDNKILFHNKRCVRAWLSETMVSEYWWVDKESKELKVDIWSPFRGDRLVPQHDSKGSLVGFYRFYELPDPEREGQKVQHAMYINATSVTNYIQERGNEWQEVSAFAHGFAKLPLIYMSRPKPLCDPIRTIRNRIEFTLSNFADCNDYHYAPKLVIRADDFKVHNNNPKGRDKKIVIQGDGDVRYLTWQQSPEVLKVEVEGLLDMAYALTNTPRTSPREISSAGAVSGEAFKYIFVGTNLAVRDHEEVVGEYLQRRINFLLHALATIHPELASAEEMMITPKITPYTLEEGSGEDDTTSNG